MLVRKITNLSEAEDGDEFVLSDASVDRYGDVIEPTGWDLQQFKKNPIALFGHDSAFPIGKWQNLRIEDGALRGRLQLAQEGTSTRHDEIRKLVDAGILRAVSVGFKPIEISDDRLPGGGVRYKRQELLETSLVSVPANPNALLVAKSLGVSNTTLKEVFKQGKAATIGERISRSREITRLEHVKANDRARALLKRLDQKYGKSPASATSSPKPASPKPTPENIPRWAGHDLRVKWRGQVIPTFEWTYKGKR